jgi:hypothetical protein
MCLQAYSSFGNLVLILKQLGKEFNLNMCVQVSNSFGILIEKGKLGINFNLNMCSHVCNSFGVLIIT